MRYFSGKHYFHDSWKLCMFLKCCNLFCFSRKKSQLPKTINNILVCNWANLGDVLLATSILPALKEKWPKAKIGFLTSTASQIVLKGNPLIDKIHIAPQYKNSSRFLRFLQSLISSNDPIIKEIDQEHYDLAIDLHPFFPNCSYLLRTTNIPLLLEFDSARFHTTKSQSVNFPDKLSYLPNIYSAFLEVLNISHNPLKPCLHFTNTSPLKDQDYVVLHVGTTEERREWPIHHWKNLAKQLSSEGKLLVFTGRGKREQEAIIEISSSLPHCINLCDKLDWDGFVSVIKEAQFVISVNTVTIHLAALLNTPGIGLYIFTREPELWIPDYGSLHYFVHKGPHVYFSDPDFLKNRKNITDLLDITPSDVFSCFKCLL